MTSIIKVDQIQLANGNAPTAADLGLDISGNTIQMEYTTITAGSVTTTTTKVEFMSVTITPKFSTSKLKVTVHCDIQQNAGNDAHFWLSRDDGSGIYNAISNDTWNGTATNDQKMLQYFYVGGMSNAVHNADQVFVMDAKVNTPVTIKLWVGAVTGTIAVGANQNYQQLIVEEIAG